MRARDSKVDLYPIPLLSFIAEVEMCKSIRAYVEIYRLRGLYRFVSVSLIFLIGGCY